MFAYNGKGRNTKYLSNETFLKPYAERTYCFIFFAHIHFCFFKLYCLFTHTLCNETHLTSFIGKEVCFVFIFLYFFCKKCILAIFLFNTSRNLCNHIRIVS